MNINILDGLDPILVQHPGDRAVLTKLEKAKLATSMISKVVDLQVRQSELELLGGGLHVTKKNMPEAYKIFGETCETLGLKHTPELYLGELPVANAFAVGADKAYINITSELFFRLEEPEIRFMFGHELGHIICGHTKYKMLVRLMTGLGFDILGPLGKAASLAMLPFQPLMMLWSRRSEYSSDRAGLLACQSLNAAASFFLKICGLPLNYYGKVDPMSIFDQADDFQKTIDRSLTDTFFASASVFNATHPRAIDRVTELKKWIDDGMYEEICEGDAETRAALAKTLRADPAEVELLQSYQQTLTKWASEEFKVARKDVARLFRKMLFEKTVDFDRTPLDKLLQVTAKIIPVSIDRVNYELDVVYGKNRQAVKESLDVLVYPHQVDRDYLSKEISSEFIKNGEKPIEIELYRYKK